MTEQQLARMAKRRLAILRHAEEITGTSIEQPPATAVRLVAAASSRLVGTPATLGTGCGGSSTAAP